MHLLSEYVKESHASLNANHVDHRVISVHHGLVWLYQMSALPSECEEVALVANIAGRDKSSTTGINLTHIHAKMGLNPWSTKSTAIKQALWDREDPVPPREMWRIPLLQKLLSQRHALEVNCKETKDINKLIDSLCLS